LEQICLEGENHEFFQQECSMKIAFIGGGIMTTALISGLFANADRPQTIQVADPEADARDRLTKKWPVSCFEMAADAIAGMDAIVLAVKPQVLPVVLDEIGHQVKTGQLVISIVAGIPISHILESLDSRTPVIRTMPNTPARIGLGITALHAHKSCTGPQRQMAQELMQAAGEVVWVDTEDLMDVVTAVSGSGPAYFFYLIEAIQKAGARLGLPEKISASLAMQTAYGASAMAVQSNLTVTELRRRVTTKGGTTEAALEQLVSGHFEQLMDTAIAAATQRGIELASHGIRK
jgi:pyrroline-5-carboxylate reductase